MRDDRVYLDYNSTSPLTEPSKRSILEAVELVGNASSIHAEGRKVKGIVEKAREQIAGAIDCEPENLVFTSGATEGAALLLRDRNVKCCAVEHPCVAAWCDEELTVTTNGLINIRNTLDSSVQLANSETGVLQKIPEGLFMSDIVQAIGKVKFSFKKSGLESAILSAHKFGGPVGVGVVVTKSSFDFETQFFGGGQEKGRRSGTENILAIAGFGSAIEFAKSRLDEGLWDRVKELRDFLEEELAYCSPNTIFIGKEVDRLPNTSCFVTDGWKGTLQVMQMDMAGFAISAGSACSSGTVKANKSLIAMGYEKNLADCGIRVSIGVETTKSQVQSFVKEWVKVFSGRGVNFT
jgi:cysteine desulfurase